MDGCPHSHKMARLGQEVVVKVRNVFIHHVKERYIY